MRSNSGYGADYMPYRPHPGILNSMDDIVYSTDPGWKDPSAKTAEKTSGTGCAGATPAKPGKPKQAEPVRISFRRGHKGSGMTTIERLQMHPAGKEELLSRLKKKFGVGGTVKLGVIELQGNRLEPLERELLAMGYKVRVMS